MKGVAKSPPPRVWKGFHGACCGTESTYAEGSTPSPWQRLFVTAYIISLRGVVVLVYYLTFKGEL